MHGPLLRWELLRLARTGYVSRVRVLVLFALLLGLVGFVVVRGGRESPGDPFRHLSPTADPAPPRYTTSLVTELALTLFAVQSLLLTCLTPASVVVAVLNEKESGNWELLLTTELTAAQIVYTKAMAHGGSVLAGVTAGVPLFVVLVLGWGLPVGIVAIGYGLTLCSLLSAVALGVVAACLSLGRPAPKRYGYRLAVPTTLAGLTVGFLVPLLVLAGVDWDLSRAEPRVFGCLAGQFLFAVVVLKSAGWRLKSRGETFSAPEPTCYPEPPRGRPLLSPGLTPDRQRAGTTPPVDEYDPIGWKEQHFGPGDRRGMRPGWAAVLRLTVATLATVSALFGLWQLLNRAVRALDPTELEKLLDERAAWPMGLGTPLIVAGLLAATLYLVPLATGLAESVAGERRGATLDLLLTTPLDRRGLILSKVRAHVEKGLGYAAGAVAGLAGGFGADYGLGTAMAAVVAFLGGVVCLAGTGAWLSVRCDQPGSAFRRLLPVLLSVGGVQLGCWLVCRKEPTLSTEVLAGAAIGFLLVGVLLGWRAGTELDRRG